MTGASSSRVPVRRWRTRGERVALALVRALRRHRIVTLAAGMLVLLAAAASLILGPAPAEVPVAPFLAVAFVTTCCVAAVARRVTLAAIALTAIAAASLAGTAAGTAVAGAFTAAPVPAMLMAAALAAAAGAVLPSVAVFRAYRGLGIGIALATDETAVGLADLLPATGLAAVIGWLPLAIAGMQAGAGLGCGLMTASLLGFAIGLALLPALLAAFAGDGGDAPLRRPSQTAGNGVQERWRAGLIVVGVILAVAGVAAIVVAGTTVATTIAGIGGSGAIAIGLIVALLPLTRGGIGGVGPALLLIGAGSLTALAVACLAGFAGDSADSPPEMAALALPAVVSVAVADALTLLRRRRAMLLQPLAVTVAPGGAALSRPIMTAVWWLALVASPAPAEGVAAILAAATAVSMAAMMLAAAWADPRGTWPLRDG
ncbi:MAG: hypothetical protein MUE49_03375 [Rhodospirillales bacterium]|nr:hypothetical protein [Rhodospirillales bacterium]